MSEKSSATKSKTAFYTYSLYQKFLSSEPRFDVKHLVNIAKSTENNAFRIIEISLYKNDDQCPFSSKILSNPDWKNTFITPTPEFLNWFYSYINSKRSNTLLKTNRNHEITVAWICVRMCGYICLWPLAFKYDISNAPVFSGEFKGHLGSPGVKLRKSC